MRYTLRIASLLEAPGMIRALRPTHLLSLCEPTGLAVPPGTVWERVVCADTERPDAAGAPRPEQVARILAFGRSVPDAGRLLIHCEAGVSRSGAAALALLTQEIGIKEAEDLLTELRPQAFPNALIVRLADRHLGLAGALTATLPRIHARADDYRAEQLAGGS